ncbi:MAG: thiolase family protein [Firmicutes bacterium]|nr:thiolase family protein [Bacillota bacterium]
MNNVMIVSAARTPFGAFGGQLKDLSEQQLGASMMLEAVQRAGIDPEKIDEVIVGTAKQTSKPSNCGRHAMLVARLPEKVPAYTVQRNSASGLQAIVNGYWAIKSGDAGVILAGGTESMSQIPFEIRNARYEFTEKQREIVDAIPAQEVGAQPVEKYGVVTMAQVAENLAKKYRLSDEEQINYSSISRERAKIAVESGQINEEIGEVVLKKGKKEEKISKDELTNAQDLLAKPADAAAMCLLASPEKVRELSLPCLGQILSVGIAAGDPRYTGLGIVEASRIALKKANLALADIDVIELNEISAAQCLAIFREWQGWGVNPDELVQKVNPNGGALATGNPWGAMGAVLFTKLIFELRRREAKKGLVALAAEGGQGMALIVQKV